LEGILMPGWFDFINGQTLPASRVQEFLMDQSVMKFADSGSRAAALPFPTDGMVSYLTDIDRLFVYRSSSSAWVQIAESTNLAALSSALPTRRNAILNSSYDVWQRGTSISNFGFFQLYTADRWAFNSSNSGRTISRQVTNDTTNLPDVQFCARLQRDSGNADGTLLAFSQSIETSNSIPFAGKAITFSFYARRGANYSATSNLLEAAVFSGTGTDQSVISGFTGQTTVASSVNTLTTTWQRFTISGTVPASNRQLAVRFVGTPTGTAGANDWFEVTGVQLEAGSVATPFTRAATTLQGELAACQRYYYRSSGPTFAVHGQSQAYSTTQTVVFVPLPVPMRTTAAAIDFANLQLLSPGVASIPFSTLTISGGESTTQSTALLSGGSTGLTQFRQYYLSNANNAAGYIGISAEL
jgi:hypothetical protein